VYLNVEGLLRFLPVRDAGLPEPYATGTAKEKQLYELTDAGQAQYANNMQKINNHTAIAEGNKEASGRVDKYNGELTNYWLNGGPTSGLPLPVLEDLKLEDCYEPAIDATAKYHPPANGQPGYYEDVPGTAPTDPAPWVLPAGRPLYVVVP
jgi:hypothetical protein